MNRVDPWGRVFETKERDYLMGNRDFGDAWIACALRHPDGTTGPSTVQYTKLFFLDDVTALAAGHRPSGVAAPSQADELITARIRDALVHGTAHRLQRSATGADNDLRVLEFECG